MKEHIQITYPVPGIACFPIRLPGNPLKWLNCYVIQGDKNRKNLLIDCGFRMTTCREDLLAGMQYLGLVPDNTDVFFTHAHPDHTGNARFLQDLGYSLIMGRIDYEMILNNNWEQHKKRALEEGMPTSVLNTVFSLYSPFQYASEEFNAITVEEGAQLKYGDFHFKCILCPGHTPGHISLYDETTMTMITGDHILFDITPNISTRGYGTNALKDYLNSLTKIRNLPVKHALPAHRSQGSITCEERATQLIQHYQQRLEEIEHIVVVESGLTAYEIASRMKWKIHVDDWRDFPVSQKWFAVNETLALLDYLVQTERINRVKSKVLFKYFI